MFGDWGALLLQFLITAVVVLGLVAVVYWLVRRYSAAGLGRIGRGRVPRLAIIDAMSVDGRRRLVLVRRDNVEHLILIGGPSDLVVEQAIQRPRRKAAAGSGDAEANQAQPEREEPHPAPAPPPVPATQSRPYQRSSASNGAEGGSDAPGGSGSGDRSFSFRRAQAPQPANQPAPAPRRGEEAPSARFVDLQRPTRIEPTANAAAHPPEESEPLFPELPTADLPEPDEIPPPPAQNGSAPRQSHLEPGNARPAPPATPSPYAKPVSESAGGNGNLAELENEMARLLGEITQKRTT